MLLNNEPGGARRERVLIAAQIGSRTRLAYRRRDLPRGCGTAPDDPNPQHITFAVGHGDDAVA